MLVPNANVKKIVDVGDLNGLDPSDQMYLKDLSQNRCVMRIRTHANKEINNHYLVESNTIIVRYY